MDEQRQQMIVRICSLVDYNGIPWGRAISQTVPQGIGAARVLDDLVRAGLKAERNGGWPALYAAKLNAPFQWPDRKES